MTWFALQCLIQDKYWKKADSICKHLEKTWISFEKGLLTIAKKVLFVLALIGFRRPKVSFVSEHRKCPIAFVLSHFTITAPDILLFNLDTT